MDLTATGSAFLVARHPASYELSLLVPETPQAAARRGSTFSVDEPVAGVPMTPSA